MSSYEYVYNPSLLAGDTVSSVNITHEYRRSGALTAAKLEIYEADTDTWHDEPLILPGAANVDISQTINVSSYINSVNDLNNLKIRFLAYRSSIVASITTSHDFLGVQVDYNAPTSTPPDTPTETETPTETLTPSQTFTPSDTPTPTDTATDTPTATPTSTSTPPTQYLLINEVVTAPRQDWNDTLGGDAVPFNNVPGSNPTFTDSDEWLELYNAGVDSVNLLGWTLVMDDGATAATLDFNSPGAAVFVFSNCGSLTNFQPGEYLVIGNPPDAMNNDTHFTLNRADASVADDFQLGAGGAPLGNTTNTTDEAVARVPNASATFGKQAATIGYANDLLTATPTPVPACSTATPTATLTPTHTATPTLTPTTFPARVIILNEAMWMGTAADANDEWIELYNTSGIDINLAGWTLAIDDGAPPDDTVINLGGVIPAGGYFLLERTDENTVSDNTCSSFIYTGSMSNDGRRLNLRDPSFTSIDTANFDGGPWPAGLDSPRASMERINTGPDTDGNWSTNYGHVANGHDADGNLIRGTPCAANSNLTPTPAPTAFARVGVVRLNEVLPNPGRDWSSYYPGGPAPYEYVELVNLGGAPVDISYWMIDDKEGGSAPFVLWPDAFISPGDHWCLGAKPMGLSFNDRDDSARLLYPDGSVVDEVSWTTTQRDDRSISRSPEGYGEWYFDWQPTPCMGNIPHAVGSKYGPKPTPVVASIQNARAWGDGAWVTIIGRVTGPHPLFGARVIYVQDDSGYGLAVYLGKGVWPPMQLGQAIKAAGYIRTRNGERELYVKNAWLYSLGEPGPAPTPRAVLTGAINDDTEGTLVSVTGKVTRLEANAFWLDDGSGSARVFFKSTTGVKRPKLKRGQLWTATGIVSEYTTRTSRAKGHRILIRLASDVALVNSEGVTIDLTPTATSLPEEAATPTLLPEETETPTPTAEP